MQLLSVTQGQAEFIRLPAYMKKVWKREKLSGPEKRIFIQMSLKTLYGLQLLQESSWHGVTQTVVGIQSVEIRYEKDMGAHTA